MSRCLLLEPQRYEAVQGAGEGPPTWYASDGGLFSSSPHVVVQENFWDADSRAATTRFYVIDAKTAEVGRHAMTTQAYTESEYGAMLADGGFEGGDFLELLPGTSEEDAEALLAIVARKAE